MIPDGDTKLTWIAELEKMYFAHTRISIFILVSLYYFETAKIYFLFEIMSHIQNANKKMYDTAVKIVS